MLKELKLSEILIAAEWHHNASADESQWKLLFKLSPNYTVMNPVMLSGRTYLSVFAEGI